MTDRWNNDGVTTDPTAPEAPECIAGRYELQQRLGEGAMGAVYAALDLELDEKIALKVLHPAIASTEGALERFRREVKLARRVTHANVARTYDFGRSGDVRFITMELIVGNSLADRIEAGPLGLADSLRIGSEIAQGLAAAHLAGVVHRDLKPENVLIDLSGAGPDGGERTVITDFGIAIFATTTPASSAKQTQPIAGTPAYMAPEQLEGKELDGRADVYALGVIMYELLTGQLPFSDDTPYALAVRRLTEDPPDPRQFIADLPDPIVRLVLDMLARERATRPDTQAVIDRLDALRGGGRARATGVRATDPGGSSTRLAAYSGVVDPRVAALYHEATAALARFGLEHTSHGIEILRRAEAIAPSDPFIASALGAALVQQWSFQNDRALLGQAEEYSLRALAANPHIGETFNTIGMLRLHQGELRAAVRAFEEAAARSPRLAEPHSYIGRLLAESGKEKEAEARLNQAIRLDPKDYYAASELSRMAALKGDWERADTLLEQVLASTGQRIVLATQARYALWRKDLGRLNQLVTEIDNSNDPAFHLVKRVFVPIWTAFVVNDEIAPNDPRLGVLRSTAAGTSMRMTTFWHQLLAEIYAALSHTSAAIDSIERAVGRSLVDVVWLDRCVLLGELRADVRFVRARTATAGRAAALWR